MRELWRAVVGFGDRYEVSNCGNVRALFVGNHGQFKAGRLLRPEIKPSGYLVVRLYRKDMSSISKRVHVLILESFVGPRPDNQVARHLDGIKTHNVVENLKWGTTKENCQDAKRHGTWLHGERCRLAKLTEKDVLEIRDLYDNKILHSIIAEYYGIAQPTVSQIGRRMSWRHLL